MYLDYSEHMLMNRRTVVLPLTIWCLLASWLCFGGLELLEQGNLIPEVAAEDQDGQDLDEAALSQVASGLKEVSEPAVCLSINTIHQFGSLMVHSPPSLRLHQQLSVYRI
jgi:hypothetical protein